MCGAHFKTDPSIKMITTLLLTFLSLLPANSAQADVCSDHHVLCQGAFGDSSLALHLLKQEAPSRWIPEQLLEQNQPLSSILKSLIFISYTRNRAQHAYMPRSGIRLVLDCTGKHLHILEPTEFSGRVWESFLTNLKAALTQAIRFDEFRHRLFRPAFSIPTFYTLELGTRVNPYRGFQNKVEWKQVIHSQGGGLAALGSSQIPIVYITQSCFPPRFQPALPRPIVNTLPAPRPPVSLVQNNDTVTTQFTDNCGELMQSQPGSECMQAHVIARTWSNTHPEFVPPPIPEESSRNFVLTSIGLYCQPPILEPSSSCEQARSRMQEETSRFRNVGETGTPGTRLPDLNIITAWQQSCYPGPRLDWCLNAYRQADIAH